MADRSDRVLYVGTADGAYLAEPRNGGFEARPMGLQGEGAIRNPIVIDRDDPRLLFAGTSRGGAFRSKDGGQTWQEINQGIVYKELWSLVQQPATGDLYAGTGPTAIFKSADRGDTWVESEQLRTLPETKDWTFPRPPHVSHVKGLDVTPAEPMRVLGAVEEGWLIRSVDGGKTWENVKQGTHFDSHSVITMPDDPNVVISTSGHGVYRSEDGGESFGPASEGMDCVYMAQIVVHPARPSVLFTAAAEVPPPFWGRPEGANSAFFRSEDQARSWTKLRGGLPDHFKEAPRATAGDPEDPDSFYVGMNDGSVWMSEDGGESFRKVLAGVPEITSLRVVRK